MELVEKLEGRFRISVPLLTLNIWSDMPKQTNREQFDQGLHCLPYHQNILDRFPSAESRKPVVCYWRKYVHKYW